MKNKNLLIITLIFIIILLSVQLIINKNEITNRKTKTIKEMSSTTQEIELNNQINTLNSSHEEYAKNVQNYKKKIAEAITNQGVPTSEDDTVETMTENIEKILQLKTTKLTTLSTITNDYTTSTKSIDLTSLLDDYTKYTTNDFIILPRSVGYYGNSTSGSGSSNYGARSGTSEISFTYDNNTGLLSVSGLVSYTYINKYIHYYGYIASFDVILIG